MARSPKALVKPQILVWAREDAGYAIDDVAKRLSTKAERVATWEAGEDQPTVKQLRRLAQIYKRPLAVFYLQEVPTRFQVMHDFRRLPDEGTPGYSPQLLFEMRTAQQRRALALELLDEIGEQAPDFELGARMDEDPEEIGPRVREALNIDPRNQFRWTDARQSFNTWRGRLEGLGVLVFQATQVSTAEMRGFSIAERRFPVIVVNRKDALNGRTFSLLHELAHLMIHRSGLCEMDEWGQRRAEDQAVEVFCNAVAAATLMPRELFLAEEMLSAHGARSEQWTHDEIRTLARRFNVSREAVARRLLTFGRTTQRFYRQMREQLDEEFALQQARTREQFKNSEFKRNPPQEAVSDYGKPFVRLVLDNYHQDRITLSEVSSYLGIRTRHVPTVESKVMR